MCSMEKMFGLEMFVISHGNRDGNMFVRFFSRRYNVPDAIYYVHLKFMSALYLSGTLCTIQNV